MSRYIPRILLCGDADNFLPNFLSENTAQVDIVGQIDFVDEKIFLDDAEISGDELRKILDDTADYLLFDDAAKIENHAAQLGDFADRIITCDGLARYGENFFTPANAEILADFICHKNINRLLDADNFFAKTDFFHELTYLPAGIDIVDENSLARDFPFVADNYRKIFPSLAACRLQTYDAILLTADRDADEFFDALVATDDMSENVLTFVRKNSALESWLAENLIAFAEVDDCPAINGSWIFLRKRVPPENFCVYFAANAPDGENIDGLNRYLGELTALYRVWKNTHENVIGFVTAGRKIFSADEVTDILRDSDVIIAQRKIFDCSQREYVTAICGEYLNEHVEKIFRKHIKRTQPDYLSAFERVSGGQVIFPQELFVTRRKIFDAYCAWLFSFLLDVTEEVLATTNLAAVDNPQKSCVVEMTAQRLLTVWLMKNSLWLREVI